MAPRIAYLGMGNMGKAMSQKLADKADLERLTLWNRSLAKAQEHATKCGTRTEAVESVAKAVKRSDIIWSCLSNDAAVVETYDSFPDLDICGKLFVESSTIEVETTRKVAKKILDRGAEYVQMPVWGAPEMAAAGALTCVPAGSANSVTRLKPYLEGIIAKAVVDLSGEPPEKGNLIKLIGNTFIANVALVAAEGNVLAEKSGLGVDNLQKFFAAVLPGAYQVHSNNQTSGHYHQGHINIATVDGFARVAGAAKNIAVGTQTRMPLLETSLQTLQATKQQKVLMLMLEQFMDYCVKKLVYHLLPSSFAEIIPIECQKAASGVKSLL